MAGTAPGHPTLPQGRLQSPEEVQKGPATRGPGSKALAISGYPSICLSIHPPIWLGLNPASSSSPSLAAITHWCRRFNSLYLFIIAIVS